MEYWIKEEGGSTFRFPVIPGSFEVSEKTNITSVQANEIGEIGMYSGSNLSTVSFSCFFPNQTYNFVDYRNFPTPYECAKKIRDWRQKGTVVRLIITETDINMETMIEDFVYREQDGTRDVYFDITFKEYKRITINKKDIDSSNTGSKPEDNKPRPDPPKQEGGDLDGKPSSQRTYVVKKGDTLWDIAKKYYGKGGLYTKIYNANKSVVKDPNRIYPGQKLIIP